MLWSQRTGLNVRIPGPVPDPAAPVLQDITEEAAITAPAGEELRVELLAERDALVAQGQPVLRLRHHPEIVLTAPMAGRIADVRLAPGRRLVEVRLFREDGAGRHPHEGHAGALDGPSLRSLLLSSGLWPGFRSRPFGRLPRPGETPAAIFVMARDTRPFAPDPRRAIEGSEEAFARGMAALLTLTEGPVYLAQDTGPDLLARGSQGGRTRLVKRRTPHPWGQAGPLVHALHPARLERPVWDIHAEDVAAIGALLRDGLVPDTRLVSVTGPALREARLVRCQTGADLRSLSLDLARPGPHRIVSGSALEGRPARWLGLRDRQVSVLPAHGAATPPHWLLSALRGAARPLPVISSAALEAALGGAIPALPLLRALAAGDQETAIRLGALSLVEEDLSLADYVTSAAPKHAAQLAALLAAVQAEEAA